MADTGDTDTTAPTNTHAGTTTTPSGGTVLPSGEIEYTLRLDDTLPPPLDMALDKAEVRELLGSVADDILLVEIDSGPMLFSALDAVKTACGTDWQRDASDPRHDCSQTALGQTFTGPDGTWKSSAEYAMVRILTMTPANSVVSGTSIEGLQDTADFLEIGGGFAQILSDSLEIPAGAGALGALACAKNVRSTPGKTALVKSLGWRAPAGQLPALRPDELDDSVSEATHLLIRDTAHPIGEGDLNLRFGETGRLEIIAKRGDDRTDFALRRSAGGLQLEYSGNVGVLVNAKPAEPGTRLHSGDRIAVAGSTEETQLITVSSDGP